MILQVGVFHPTTFHSTLWFHAILQEQRSKHVFLAGDEFFSKTYQPEGMLYQYLQLSAGSSSIQTIQNHHGGGKGGYKLYTPLNCYLLKTSCLPSKKKVGGSPW